MQTMKSGNESLPRVKPMPLNKIAAGNLSIFPSVRTRSLAYYQAVRLFQVLRLSESKVIIRLNQYYNYIVI